MKMKIMNVCSVALLAIGIWACSGQKKGTANVEVATDSVEVTADAKSVQADSTGYIVRVGEMAPDFTITLTDGKQVSLSSLRGKVVMLQFKRYTYCNLFSFNREVSIRQRQSSY